MSRPLQGDEYSDERADSKTWNETTEKTLNRTNFEIKEKISRMNKNMLFCLIADLVLAGLW